MNIAKAIEILAFSLQYGYQPEVEDLNTAVQLGIEALKTIKAERTIYGFKRQVRLPGETEE